MLTQGPAPDPKSELNITSFFTLSHPLHCPICAKDIMVTVLLLFFYFLFCFFAVINCSFMTGT